MIDLDNLIRRAIGERRLIQFDYQGATRIGEPHDYGLAGGRVRLLVYQLRGGSTGPLPGWRMVDVSGITNPVMLDEPFRGSRGDASRSHKRWDEIFVRVR